MTDLQEYVAARARHHDMSLRLVWGGAAVNGAALLAVTNIVANVPSPDVAARALAVPVALFAAGILFGGRAIGVALKIAGQRMLHAIEWDRCETAIRRQSTFKAMYAEMPISIELARIIHGDSAEDEVRRLYAGVVARAQSAQAETDNMFKEASAAQVRYTEEIERIEKRLAWWHSLSMGAGTAGVVWALIQPLFGVSLGG